MASRPNKAAIESALDEWTRLTVRAAKIERERDTLLEPITARYEKQCAPLRNAASEKLDPINERRAKLALEIQKQLELGIDPETGTVSLPQVAIETQISARKTVTAIAEVQPGEGAREIDPREFFQHTPPARRDGGFWGCLKVLIGPAEKYLGAAIDALAKKPRTFNVKISLRGVEQSGSSLGS